MSYHPYSGYNTSRYPCFIVQWGLQWQLLDRQEIEAGADLRAAMATAIERVRADGWQPESKPDFGFVFLRRDGERRLLSLTERDPRSTRRQSFDPYGRK